MSPGQKDKKLLAFPGAEGFGQYTRGGRGGALCFVTNLKDYKKKEAVIPGSLRAALEQKGPRTVLFRVSGTIRLTRGLKIKNPYVTIAGQSAPGAGICLRNYGLSISAKEVIVRYLRVRPGDEIGRKQKKPWQVDAISIGEGSKNVILDHCSTSWANDEVLSVSGKGVTHVTVQWCMITESLNDSTHKKGTHGYGSLIRSNGKISFHHNLYAFHRSRSPRPGTYGDGSILFDFRNNVMHKGGRGYTSKDPVRMNFIGNYHKNTPFEASETCRYFGEDNLGDFKGGEKQSKAFSTANVQTSSAEDAYKAVLERCGAVLPKRDAVDSRVVKLVKENGGALINSEMDVGAWPKLKSERAPKDRDRDGMPTKWEKKYRLSSTRTSHNRDRDKDGYTDLEEYLNGTDPRKSDDKDN
ncbi:MAG: pectate lyase [Planctomycetota bacterium]|nr:pectate lyase [Planctomycetota bacterium]